MLTQPHGVFGKVPSSSAVATFLRSMANFFDGFAQFRAL
jgi:hypothetical protein